MFSTVWRDGDLLPRSDATLPITAAGVATGAGVFETMRSNGDGALALTRHLRRLRRGLDAIELFVKFSDATVRDAVEAVLADGTGPARVRITVVAGVDGPVTAVSAESLGEIDGTAAALVVPWRRNEHTPLVGIKTTSYLENTVAHREAVRSAADEAIFANTSGQLCEGSRSNVFVVHDGVVSTPSLLSACLPGVTRELVLEVAPDVREATLDLEAIHTADEVFLTSSLRHVQACHRIDGRSLDAPGPHTARIAAALEALFATTPDP